MVLRTLYISKKKNLKINIFAFVFIAFIHLLFTWIKCIWLILATFIISGKDILSIALSVFTGFIYSVYEASERNSAFQKYDIFPKTCMTIYYKISVANSILISSTKILAVCRNVSGSILLLGKKYSSHYEAEYISS